MVIQVCLVPVFESDVVEAAVIIIGESVVMLHAIVSIVEALYVSRVVVEFGIAELRFAVCLRLDWSEGEK
jgi:hypothetical protein